VEGPLALDNAVSGEAARHKGITIEFAGQAGIVMGAKAPIVVVSRSDSVGNKLNSLALGALAMEAAARMRPGYPLPGT
jgi:phosphotransacetylase